MASSAASPWRLSDGSTPADALAAAGDGLDAEAGLGDGLAEVADGEVTAAGLGEAAPLQAARARPSVAPRTRTDRDRRMESPPELG